MKVGLFLLIVACSFLLGYVLNLSKITLLKKINNGLLRQNERYHLKLHLKNASIETLEKENKRLREGIFNARNKI